MSAAAESNDACDEAVKEIVKLRGQKAAMLEALELFLADAYLDNGTLCGWCGYRTEIGGGHIHNDVCRVGKSEAAIRLAKGESQ